MQVDLRSSYIRKIVWLSIFVFYKVAFICSHIIKLRITGLQHCIEVCCTLYINTYMYTYIYIQYYRTRPTFTNFYSQGAKIFILCLKNMYSILINKQGWKIYNRTTFSCSSLPFCPPYGKKWTVSTQCEQGMSSSSNNCLKMSNHSYSIFRGAGACC